MVSHLLACCHGAAPVKITGEYDFKIAVVICIAIVFIVFLIILGFLIWKWSNDCALKRQSAQRRQCEKEDMDRKERMNLLDKKLEFLNVLCYVNKEEKPKKLLKDEREDANKYTNAIDDAIKTFYDPKKSN